MPHRRSVSNFQSTQEKNMATMLAIKGNRTTTGGEVLEGDEDFSDIDGALAKDGGLASCGRCGHNGPMLGTAQGWGLTGSAAAVKDNDIVACQCPRGTNRVIARSDYYDE
jgi:uncharacterized Zn-binding protein involved in type VI secretion